MTPIERQTILITGATDGLGKALAHELARRGATLILHGRSDARGRQTLDEIRAATGNDRLRFMRADFASFDDVRALAHEVEASTKALHVLVNNAGLGSESRRATSRDGYEMVFQVDYLAPFLLTRLLLPLLERSAPSRIVNVASLGQAPLDFDDLMLERHYDGTQAYRQAKLAQISFTFDLAEKLRGKALTVNALHPATFMPTKMVVGRYPPASTIADGVRATLRFVIDPTLDDVTGRFFDRECETRAHPQAHDAAARERLRVLSERLTGLADNAPVRRGGGGGD